MRIFLLDNYDSFTWNLWDYLTRCGATCIVGRNDKITIDQIEDLQPDGIVLSPGPCVPAVSGILPEVIAHFHDKRPLLGICLGHQGIGEYFGAQLVRADLPMHGKTSDIIHHGEGLFKDIPSPMQVMRYHSLLLKDMPAELHVTAHTTTGEIMAFQHRTLPVAGVQFHPESVLTPDGLTLLKNWIAEIRTT